MKIYKQLLMIMMIITIISCNRKKDDSSNSGDDTAYFKTQAEAVVRGKNDLISILRSNSGFQIAISQDLLQKAQPGITVRHLEVDFDQLLKQDQTNDLNQLKNNAKSNINTLMVENNVLTVIQTANSDKGWTVTGLADASLSNELSEILSAQSNSKIEEITLFEIPNLQAFVYQVKTPDGERYFTSYNGFSLKEGLSVDQLYPLLHSDALVLERTYGDELKLKKLVK
ncbi:MAG TPA: hypothetical protein VFF27_15515 [Bacteroidia bacterium]|nr:hypothetical protein [Bacteroidia bacterium]